MVLLQPSESSSRLHESSNLMFLHSCLSRLPFELVGRLLFFSCGLLGVSLGSTWSFLCASWTQLGGSWADFGALGGQLGFHLALQTGLQAQLCLQSGLQVLLGASWVDFWCSCIPQNQALASTGAKFSCFCTLAFQDCLLSLLGASWAQLVASWAPLGLNLEPLMRLLDPTWRLLG